MRDRILTLLDNHPNLPAFPDILVRLDEELKSKSTSNSRLAAIIETEPALAGRILTIARSAQYGSKSIGTMSDAITRLGINEINKLSYCLIMSRLFHEDMPIDMKEFWQHSMTVAHFTRQLCRHTSVSVHCKETAYYGGLMHDLGILIFAYLIPSEYKKMIDSLPDQNENFLSIESKRFGINHTELGAEFMKKWWDLDEGVVHAAQYHHKPFEAPKESREVAALVHIADHICSLRGVSNPLSEVSVPFNESAWHSLGLSLELAEQIFEDVTVSFDSANEMLNS